MDKSEILDAAMVMCRTKLMDKGIPPTVFFFVKTAKGYDMVEAPFDEIDQARALMRGILRTVLEVESFHGYAFVSEAWMTKRDTFDGPMPSKDPNRIEVVSIQYGVRNDMKNFHMVEILRNANGSYENLKELSLPPMANFLSTFFDEPD